MGRMMWALTLVVVLATALAGCQSIRDFEGWRLLDVKPAKVELAVS